MLKLYSVAENQFNMINDRLRHMSTTDAVIIFTAQTNMHKRSRY